MSIKSYKAKISKVGRLCFGPHVYFNADHFDAEFKDDFKPDNTQDFRAWVQTEWALTILKEWSSEHRSVSSETLAYQFDLLNAPETLKENTPLWVCRGVLLIYAFFNMPEAKAQFLSNKLLSLSDTTFGHAHMYGCPLREYHVNTDHVRDVEDAVISELNSAVRRYCERHNISQAAGELGTPYAQVYRTLTQGLLLGHSPSQIASHILKNTKGDYVKSTTVFRTYATRRVIEALTHMELDTIYLLERDEHLNFTYSDALSYLIMQIKLEIIPKYKYRLFTNRTPFVVIATHDLGKQGAQVQLLLQRNGELVPQLVDFGDPIKI